MVEKTANKNPITAKLIVTLIIIVLAISYLFIIAGIIAILIIFFVLWLGREINEKISRNGDKKS